MRDTTRTVTFSDFTFQHSYRGNIVDGNTITVVEPSFADRAVYRQMKAWVADAFRNMQTQTTSETRAAAADLEAEVGREAMEAAAAEIDPYVILSMGLTGDRFAEFCAYVEKVLTNNARLAYCGTDAEHGVPVTQIVWEAIAKGGGIEAMEKVCATFAGFFLPGLSRPTSTKPESTTGSETPSGPPADPLAPSPSHKRKR